MASNDFLPVEGYVDVWVGPGEQYSSLAEAYHTEIFGVTSSMTQPFVIGIRTPFVDREALNLDYAEYSKTYETNNSNEIHRAGMNESNYVHIWVHPNARHKGYLDTASAYVLYHDENSYFTEATQNATNLSADPFTNKQIAYRGLGGNNAFIKFTGVQYVASTDGTSCGDDGNQDYCGERMIQGTAGYSDSILAFYEDSVPQNLISFVYDSCIIVGDMLAARVAQLRSGKGSGFLTTSFGTSFTLVKNCLFISGECATYFDHALSAANGSRFICINSTWIVPEFMWGIYSSTTTTKRGIFANNIINVYNETGPDPLVGYDARPTGEGFKYTLGSNLVTKGNSASTGSSTGRINWDDYLTKNNNYISESINKVQHDIAWQQGPNFLPNPKGLFDSINIRVAAADIAAGTGTNTNLRTSGFGLIIDQTGSATTWKQPWVELTSSISSSNIPPSTMIAPTHFGFVATLENTIRSGSWTPGIEFASNVDGTGETGIITSSYTYGVENGPWVTTWATGSRRMSIKAYKPEFSFKPKAARLFISFSANSTGSVSFPYLLRGNSLPTTYWIPSADRNEFLKFGNDFSGNFPPDTGSYWDDFSFFNSSSTIWSDFFPISNDIAGNDRDPGDFYVGCHNLKKTAFREEELNPATMVRKYRGRR
jgi:hypothetical protein